MSLRSRVALFMALGIALALLLQGVLGYLAFQRLVLNDLNHDLDGFTSRLVHNVEQSTELDSLQASYEGYVVHARLLKGPKPVHDLTQGFPAQIAALTLANGYHTVGKWRVKQMPLKWEGQPLTLQAVMTSPEFTAGLRNYRQTVTSTALLVVLLGAAVAYAVSGYALQPLRTLTQISSRIARSGHLNESVPVTGVGQGEMNELALSFNRMLARLSEFRTREARFNRQVAHELRTPLTAMSLALDTAQNGDLTPEETYGILREEVDSTKRLTASLLILAREGTLAHTESVDVAALARECAQAYQAQYHGPGHASLFGDLTLLRRALENLLENARKYAQGAPVALTCQVTPAGLEVVVEDHGPGLPPEALPRLSEEFYRAGQAKTTGSGLGLSVVRHIVQAHQGELSFEAATPHGLRVKLLFREHTA